MSVFIVSSLWFLSFSFLPHFFFILFITSLFSPPSLSPAFPPFLLSWNRWYQKRPSVITASLLVSQVESQGPERLSPVLVGVAGGPMAGTWAVLAAGHAGPKGHAASSPKWISATFHFSPILPFSALLSSHISSAGDDYRREKGWGWGQEGKGFDQTVQTLRGCGEASTSRPDWWKFLRFQYVCTQWLCNSASAIHFRKCTVYTGAFTVAFSAALFVLAEREQRNGNSLNIYP